MRVLVPASRPATLHCVTLTVSHSPHAPCRRNPFTCETLYACNSRVASAHQLSSVSGLRHSSGRGEATERRRVCQQHCKDPITFTCPGLPMQCTRVGGTCPTACTTCKRECPLANPVCIQSEFASDSMHPISLTRQSAPAVARLGVTWVLAAVGSWCCCDSCRTVVPGAGGVLGELLVSKRGQLEPAGCSRQGGIHQESERVPRHKCSTNLPPGQLWRGRGGGNNKRVLEILEKSDGAKTMQKSTLSCFVVSQLCDSSTLAHRHGHPACAIPPCAKSDGAPPRRAARNTAGGGGIRMRPACL